MELYRRGRIWWAWGYDRHGERWRKSTKQRDKTAARTVAAKIEQELALDAHQPRDEACTLEVACDHMMDHAERADRSPATIEFLQTKCRHLFRLFGKHKRCSKITLAETTNYTATRMEEGASKLTVSYEIRTLLQAMRRVAKLGLFRPTVELSTLMPDELVGVYVPRERWLPPAEYRLLVDELSPDRPLYRGTEDRRDYVVMWCQTGMRESELYRLEPELCDFDAQVIHVPGTKTRNARRVVPMTPAVESILRQRIDRGGVMFTRWGHVQRDLQIACLRIEARQNPGFEQPAEAEFKARRQPVSKAARVRPPKPFDPVTPNDLRRTFASWLAQAGVPLYDASKLMGHAGTKMLERVYARLAPETLRSAIDRLPSSVSQVPGYGVTGAVTAEPDTGAQRPSRTQPKFSKIPAKRRVILQKQRASLAVATE